MAKVKAKIKDILYRTERATLFLISESEIWLPNSTFKFGNNCIILDENIAKEKGFWNKCKPFMHTPKKLEISNNQEAIKELKII